MTDGREACKSALAYLAANADEIASIDTTGCDTAFSLACTTGESLTVPSGRFNVTITYPVADADPLMTSGIVGAGTQPIVSADRQPCDRYGVQLTATRKSLFASLLGRSESTTRVHTVAIVNTGETDPPINLLVLDRTGCQALHVQGNGGIIVDAVVTVDEFGNPTGLTEGRLAADSDGSDGCVSDGVIDLDGTGSLIRADGPECTEQTGTHTVDGYTAGEGCGIVETFAAGTPGCGAVPTNMPACSPGGGGSNPPDPDPTRLRSRLTREKVDHRYNCWGDYTVLPGGVSWATDPLTGDQEINGCTSGDPSYIYDLISAVGETGNPVGLGVWNSWSADLGRSCTYDTGDPDPPVVNGNIVFDCPTFTVKRHVRVNGNVVFQGDVVVTSSSGHLDIRNPADSPGWAFFREAH